MRHWTTIALCKNVEKIVHKYCKTMKRHTTGSASIHTTLTSETYPHQKTLRAGRFPSF